MGAKAIVINSSSHRVCREVERFIQKAHSTDTIYMVYTNDDFRTAVKSHRPWLVLLESNCWYEATPYMIAQYADTFPLMNIALFSYERLTPSKAAGFVNLGAGSFIDFRLDETEIENAFNRIMHHKLYVPHWIEGVVEKYSLAIPEYYILNKSELPVLRLLSLGNSIPDISQKLGISNGTVRNHISNVHKKFNIHSQSELIGLALRIGIVNPEELVTEQINHIDLNEEARNVYTDKG